ncbi:hypothetical protein [Nocardia brevicatena]|uniref:hypothetical protein n=1 Tax=Nocardia brevicatena TaxID=37327 RepID=UPI0003078C25|nr:hypothetical protein [Nocardia brevicatena]
MTEPEWLEEARRSSRQARAQIVHRYLHELISSPAALVVFALAGVSMYGACASFGITWATMSGASGPEAAVWPIAVTATTMLAVICRIRFQPDWYPPATRRVCNAVASAGFLLAMIGNGLHAAGYPHTISRPVAVLVNATPGFCLILSTAMAAIFLLVIRPPMPGPVWGPHRPSLPPGLIPDRAEADPN